MRNLSSRACDNERLRKSGTFMSQSHKQVQDSANSDNSSRVTAHSDTESPSGNSAVSLTVGWREWVSLPLLGLPAIKAKVDTGARTSAINATEIERFTHETGDDWVAFTVMPIQRITNVTRRCQAPLVDIRKVTDSGGHSEERYFISTTISVGDIAREVEVTLAQRADMLFRMLIGRTALAPDIAVNPALSYTLGRKNARTIYSDDRVTPGR